MHGQKEARAFDPRRDVISTGLFFTKTGKEIIDVTNRQIGKAESEIDRCTVKVNTICKDRQIDADEVFADLKKEEDDEDRNPRMIGDRLEKGYVTKATSNVRSRAALDELQVDLNRIEASISSIKAAGRRIKNLRRLVNHLNPNDKFTFDAGELEGLGFE